MSRDTVRAGAGGVAGMDLSSREDRTGGPMVEETELFSLRFAAMSVGKKQFLWSKA